MIAKIHSVAPLVTKEYNCEENLGTVYREIFAPVLFSSSMSAGEFKTWQTKLISI